MKIIFKSSLFAALLIVTACGKDDAKETVEQIENETEQMEQTPLEANKVSDNLVIEGGTKMEGDPPVPIGTLLFDVTGTSKIALLDEGFDVSINSDTEIVGAYIKIKAEDGTIADSYHDVNIDANKAANKKTRSLTKREGRSVRSANKENDVSLDVDFTTEIEAGKFCYEICVYDDNGNISEPKEVCVKVENWGGKADGVGDWTLEKWFYDYDEERIYRPGEENCVMKTRTMSCQGAQFENVESEDCVFTEYWTLKLGADGTYTEKEKIIWTTNYTDISQNPCLDEAVSEEVYTFESNGKWAYIDDQDKFVFVAYYDKEVYDGEVEEFSAEPGDDYVYYGFGNYDGEVRLLDGNLVVESFEETTVHFKK